MGRMTRAKAAEVAEKLHVDEDVVLGLPSENGGVVLNRTPEKVDRSPLVEIAPNSGSGQDDEAETTALRQSTRSRKGGKRGVKGKKGLGASTASQPETELVPDEKEAVSSPASEATMEDLVKDEPTVDTTPSHGSDTGHHEAVTQSTTEEPMETLADAEPRTLAEAQPEPATSLHTNAEEEHSELATQIAIDAPASPPPSAMPAVIASLRKGIPGQRSTSNKENVKPMAGTRPAPITLTPVVPRSHRRSSTYDALEEAVVQGAISPAGLREPSIMETPPPVRRSPASVEPGKARLDRGSTLPTSPKIIVDAPAVASPKAEDPILAMDALEEAVEKITAEVPDVQPSPAKPRTKKAAPVVRTTKASLARLSLAQADKSALTTKAPAAGRPRPSLMLARTGSVRHSVATKFEPASKRVALTSSKLPEQAKIGEKKEAVIPHSKPRPVSLSFPTPPPPPKSTKAPTTSTFQLPGAAVAAKLKAAREERASKQPVEEQKKPAFKARPVPAGMKKAPSVRQTSTSTARLSSLGEKLSAPVAGLKRANSTATSSTAAPRARIVAKEASARSPNALKSVPDRLTVAKRQSTAMGNTSKPRVSLTTGTAAPASTSLGTTQRVPSKGTLKGKEVFNRTAAAKEAAEQEKRVKEDVAKRARAAASERSRQASRDWAEKQRMKKLGLKPNSAKATLASADVKQTVTAEHTVLDEPTVLEGIPGEIVAGA
ncbi:hypothetical protein LTR36_005245 [Oleoguttula mirabilis]|uniref:Uncharacterized protein n=1 Tax=Oleoguttula mirabilis TaxID=1507867 RepID=A0AAV9JW25_9PEZI|nr:hypothetical protein LTR36_005245 [Oleoguttula mirabilis]